MAVEVDLSAFVGQRLSSVCKKDYSWFFVFDDETRVDTESQWRLLAQKVVVTSDDHGHQFGLPSPVNAAEVARQQIGDSPVEQISIEERTGDLSLTFSNGITLQFLTTSGGYEGWRIGNPKRNQLIICLGGGDLAIYEDRPRSPS